MKLFKGNRDVEILKSYGFQSTLKQVSTASCKKRVYNMPRPKFVIRKKVPLKQLMIIQPSSICVAESLARSLCTAVMLTVSFATHDFQACTPYQRHGHMTCSFVCSELNYSLACRVMSCHTRTLVISYLECCLAIYKRNWGGAFLLVVARKGKNLPAFFNRPKFT